MTHKAYVLVNTNIGSEDLVFQQILQMPKVQNIYLVYGAYDIIFKVEENDLSLLKEFIVHQIRLIPEVKATLTLIVI